MFEHIRVWGSKEQQRWFAWQRLKLISERADLPILCDCGREILSIADYPCPCGQSFVRVRPRPAALPATA